MYKTLMDLCLVDSPPQPAFDNLTALASQLLGAPVSLVSILDFAGGRQVFKSLVGLSEPWATERQTPLSHSFCQYVVRTNTPLVVADARVDPLLRDNMAIPDLGAIAYLGVPVYAPNKLPVGALCVIQSEPRAWTRQEIALLQQLASCVSDTISLNGALHDSEQLRHQHQEFAYAVSHDLKSPANTIEMVLNELLLETLSDDGRDLLLAGIMTLTRMSGQVEDVLSYAATVSHNDAHQLVDLNQLISQIQSDLAGDLTHAQATLICHSLPTVMGAGVQLRSLFQNLISNAIKFRVKDRLPVITIQATVDGLERDEIAVSDNGIGIAAENQGKIFKLFSRLHVHEDYAGTGIGLALCDRICNNHGGRLLVSSQLGSGATFTVVLPKPGVSASFMSPLPLPFAATG